MDIEPIVIVASSLRRVISVLRFSALIDVRAGYRTLTWKNVDYVALVFNSPFLSFPSPPLLAVVGRGQFIVVCCD